MASADRRHGVIERIARGAAVAKRDPSEVQLIAVSKGRTAEEIEPLLQGGQLDFGESRVQEAVAKWPALKSRYPEVRLHGIGRLQSNKAAEAIELFDTIHSVDRASLIEALRREADRQGRKPDLYIQVNIGEEEQKGGCLINEIAGLLADANAASLKVLGLMAIPPFGLEPAPYFALLAKLARRHGVSGLSMGMSADYEAAVMLGATAIRVGTALFEDS
jgi:pyridoxal phosphate enzyme (YggS family)